MKRRKDRNKLAHYKPYAKQRAFHAASATYRERLFVAGNQGHPHHFEILTPAGPVPVGLLRVGDFAIMPGGEPSQIVNIVPLGRKERWFVMFEDGREVECTAEHTWAVMDEDGNESECMTYELRPSMYTPRADGSGYGDRIADVIETHELFESSCIVIEDAAGLYVCANEIVTHNCGKTWSSAYEIAIHLTGRYPDWWEGRRWARPVVGWATGVTGESVRDTLQRLLLGRPGEWGTGTIPADDIIDVKRALGVADSVDTVLVRHITGGTSRCAFKSYEKGRERWQGETIDFLALDEEPPMDIYVEGITRTNATKGMVFMTFTPLMGMSDVVKRFFNETSPDRTIITMTIEDVDHYTRAEKDQIIASYPAHERKARAMGIPFLGSGQVFPVPEDQIMIEHIPLPDHWPRICGVDFGFNHPFAAVWLAWDRDTDTIYVYDVYTNRQGTPRQHAPMIMSRGPWVPVAWPHDGLQHSKDSGVQLAEQYRAAGVAMLHERAQYEEVEGGGQTSRFSIEAGIMDMLERMQAGRFKVFSHLADWWSEFRMYHRKDGKIVPKDDDAMSATRYAVMSLRFAAVPPLGNRNGTVTRDYNWRVG